MPYVVNSHTIAAMSLVFMVLFVVIPIVEFAIFVVVTDAIGLANALLLVLVTAAIGAALVRWQGVSVFRQFRSEQMLGQFPTSPIVHGVLVLLGGALLLTPGFLTDGVGFSLMVSPVREMIYRTGRRLVKRRTIFLP